MDDWDRIPAPQWSDFQSPNSVETFFDTLQDETITNVNDTFSDETLTNEKAPLKMISSNFIGEIDKVRMTPIRIVSPKKKNKENMIIETTYEDFLAKALKDIQLNSARCSIKRNVKNTPAKSDASEENYYTPSDKYLTPAAVTQSLVKLLKTKNSVKNLELDFQTVEEANSVNFEKSISNIKEKNNSNLNIAKQEIIKDPNGIKEEQFLPSKLITDKFTLKESKGQNNKSKNHKVLPYQNRRLSIKKIKKPEIKTQNQFVSMAEAITKFQVGTPKRFRTTNLKVEKPNALVKFTAKQLTHAVSPALRSKNRIRKTNVVSEAQKEEVEMKKKTNPIKVNTVKFPKQLSTWKKIEKKPPTIPEPFKLTNARKVNNNKNDKNDTKIQKKEIKIDTLKGSASLEFGKLKKSNSLTLNDKKMDLKTLGLNENSIKKVVNVKIPKLNAAGQGNVLSSKNTVPVVLGSDGKAITVQEKEVIHFGIRINQPKMTKTKAAPFSFDKRVKELQERKEKKLKQLQEEQVKKKKVEFHAKPVPTFKRSNSTPQLSEKDQHTIKKTTPQPFSFEKRNQMMLKKKEEFLKQAQDSDRKSRIFHANPVPNFKPVPVHVSNLKIERKKEPVIDKNKPLKGVHIPIKKEEGKLIMQKEKTKFKRTVPKIELHSDKRAKERREFDDKVKEKLRIEDERKRKSVEEEIVKQKEADAILRKQMELKARPVPEFKPVAVIKSMKPLTSPQSPAWNRNKSN